ncbi:unnamed protein product [Vitrella brassicaformis CCMP3155]|uniref:Uncharacterized protein n=1 Tax=Vitrella brassicaformis (strain CCMP3155) TaxID=1169540 RepID=A0A0G4EKJ0_VITBC|nr:unnamed protein product [Vitrella brassicaformis CCMP3155]|eukprot:CEL97960.1 unnamed protein product [Vitrella brassicaformis CCMP3155]
MVSGDVESQTPLIGQRGQLVTKDIEVDIRRDFILKVYGILATQIILTVLVALPFVLVDAVQTFVRDNSGLIGFVTILSVFGFLITFSLKPESIKTHPYGLLTLFGFTVVEGVFIGTLCVFLTPSSVLFTVGVCVVIVGSLTAWAVFAKADFTGYAPFVYVAGLVFVLFLIAGLLLMPFLPGVSVFNMVISALLVLFFSAYLVIDTQAILGGQHKYQFTVDDYVFAALAIYLDIVNMLIQLLSAFGQRK